MASGPSALAACRPGVPCLRRREMRLTTPLWCCAPCALPAAAGKGWATHSWCWPSVPCLQGGARRRKGSVLITHCGAAPACPAYGGGEGDWPCTCGAGPGMPRLRRRGRGICWPRTAGGAGLVSALPGTAAGRRWTCNCGAAPLCPATAAGTEVGHALVLLACGAPCLRQRATPAGRSRRTT